MNNKITKFQFSKLIIIVLFIVFICTLYSAIQYLSNADSYLDTAVFCTAITVIGGMLGSALIQYFKKSSTENLPKIQTSLYKDTMNIRLEYNKHMMELKHKYNLTDDDICEIENQSQIDEISDSVLNQAVSELDNRSSDAHTDIDSTQIY